MANHPFDGFCLYAVGNQHPADVNTRSLVEIGVPDTGEPRVLQQFAKPAGFQSETFVVTEVVLLLQLHPDPLS